MTQAGDLPPTPDGEEALDPADITDAYVPKAAEARLSSAAWSSGLSTADLASCLALGMEPLGFVQGYAVLDWTPYRSGAMGLGPSGLGPGRLGAGWGMPYGVPPGSGYPPSGSGYPPPGTGYPPAGTGKAAPGTGNTAARGDGIPPSPGPRGPSRPTRQPYVEQWPCMHGMIGPGHVPGVNYEQTWLEERFSLGWSLSVTRMIEEAMQLGAHGIVGIESQAQPLAGTMTREFAIRGTAVAVPGAPRPETPFSTFLSGQRLTKLLEAGYIPVSVVRIMGSVFMLANCTTRFQLSGGQGAGWGAIGGVAPIAQVSAAQLASRQLARSMIRHDLGGDHLHGAEINVSEGEYGEGTLSVECTLSGTRVRRFRAFGHLPAPRPVVRLR